jgi:hypothetical protein
MKTVFVMGCVAACLRAQQPGAPEPLTAWPYYKEIVQRGVPGLLDFVLDRDVFDKARLDQADLRLYDAAGREVPYVLRVLRAVTESDAFEAREFNRGVEGGVAQVSYDLGEQPRQHNEVDVGTVGTNFRRSVDVQGSSDGEQWSTLVSTTLFRFAANGRSAEQTSVSYPVSRYRYLRIRVSRDPETDRAAPEIATVRVRRTFERQGETATFPASLERRDADRVNGRPASIWRFDFGGRVPLDGLQLAMNAGAFSRPFQLEGVDDPAHPVDFASGDLSRRESSAEGQQQTIVFPEQFARRVKLTVTDDRNTPLGIYAITGSSAARQVVFEAPNSGSQGMRLYYGNPKALAPHYDLAARLPQELTPPPARLVLGAQHENPIYRPEPKPFSERSPWLVYVVLSLACAILAAILLNLARAAKLTLSQSS